MGSRAITATAAGITLLGVVAAIVALRQHSTAPPQNSVPASSAVSTPAWTSSPPPGPRSVPPAVADLSLAHNDAQSFTLTWQAPRSDESLEYDVTVDGRQMARTAQTMTTIPWPASTDHVLVQVAAVTPTQVHSPWRALFVVPPPVDHRDSGAAGEPEASSQQREDSEEQLGEQKRSSSRRHRAPRPRRSHAARRRGTMPRTSSPQRRQPHSPTPTPSASGRNTPEPGTSESPSTPATPSPSDTARSTSSPDANPTSTAHPTPTVTGSAPPDDASRPSAGRSVPARHQTPRQSPGNPTRPGQ
ncbi:MAG: hypothetical protein E7D41_02415 [Cutibacterium sp.]|nr:hypothetical protein [Cutibacterium sp.]